MQAKLSEIFAMLNSSGARYITVGGLAVVLHGHLRLTADVDLIIDLAPQAAAATVAALAAMGLRPRAPMQLADFAKPELRQRWIDEKGMLVFTLWDPANALRTVDLFVRMPDNFEEMYSRSIVVDLQGIPCRIASIEDLIALKRIADRPQDREDIDALLQIESEKGGRP